MFTKWILEEHGEVGEVSMALNEGECGSGAMF